ncbi:GNAT family N-acetyltransferase [Sporosarcina cyprini]|uniref:GNAT family N-acetyltransferase n=1 Tax=Sporosarcina cyprini TaxID=2910523 RepID=UPI001EE02C7B|nr:GNAT family N-acetyltransferase [Sporosarcina cyprini]MCG3088977.1 GNAT family N-acetyltransferase [Sporosarcina cyprini]
MKKQASPAVSLRRLVMEDFETVTEWSRDELFCLANGWEINRQPEEMLNWWTRCVEGISEDFIRKGVECEGQLVGYADLVIGKEESAELGIAIGNRMLWGKGIGVLASQLLMDYAVKERGIRSFYAETHESNERARRMLEKLRFQEVSRNGMEEYNGEVSRLLQFSLDTND